MLVGSQSSQGGVILLYETMDHSGAGGWTFVGKLWVETRHKTTAIECPCLLPLDGQATSPLTRWVLIFGLMNSTDTPTGRKNLTLASVGWFDGKSFSTEFEQELDFGTDNYAFQAFKDGDALVGIGWLANWCDANPLIDFPTAMTLPRNILLSKGSLCTPPIGPVESLRYKMVDRTRLAAGETVTLPTGATEILFDLDEPGLPFDLQLGHPEARVGVMADDTGLSIYYQAADQPDSPRYIAQNVRARRVRIFLDYGSIEVFADDGRWAGTKRIEGFSPVNSATIHAPMGGLRQATVWSLRL
jgi:beta-fructofuranosidase